MTAGGRDGRGLIGLRSRASLDTMPWERMRYQHVRAILALLERRQRRRQRAIELAIPERGFENGQRNIRHMFAFLCWRIYSENRDEDQELQSATIEIS